MTDPVYYGIFFAVHIIICGIYSFFCSKKKQEKQKTWYCITIAFFIPVFGLLYLLVWERTKPEVEESNTERSFFGNSKKKGKQFYLRAIDKQSEVDTVSLEEALSINTYQVRRKMIMNTLQDEDTTIYIEALKKALSNEDIETSHYATAVIMEMQRKINELLSMLEKAYVQDKTDKDCADRLESCLAKIIFGGIYDEHNLLKYNEKYRQLSDEILSEEDAEERYYNNRIRLDMKTGDFTQAKELCRRYEEKFPASEDMIICNLKYCVLTSDRKSLDELLGRLKEYPVKLTQASLKYIRFFRE